MNQNYINHIALVLDASSSMGGLSKQVITVADSQIEYLARRSKELDQETRVSVYSFNDKVECLIYDKDVLRLPSIKDLYKIGGWTALIDAAILSQNDLAKTAQLYGDHAFLTYILTDGEENKSKNTATALFNLLSNQPDNWTVAVLVPDAQGEFEAKKFGFSKNNIAIWNPNSIKGIDESFTVIRQSTDNFMQQRTTGLRSSKGIFDMTTTNLNQKTVKKLKEINNTLLLSVKEKYPIREFIEKQGITYRIGMAYYQLTKAETIQPSKQICIRDLKTLKIYSGDYARKLLGLPDMEVKVRPQDNPKYEVFVQSTSVNRNLVPNTHLLIIQNS